MSAAAQSSWKPPDADRQPSAWSPPESDRTPEPTFGQQMLNEAVINPLKQVGAGALGASATANKLTANIADAAEWLVRNTAGIEASAPLRNLSQWARQNQTSQQKQAEELSGGRTDLPSQLYRGATQGVLELPQYAIAAHVAGPVAGMGLVGAITEGDKGWWPAMQAAAEGALTGGALHVMGPASRLVRLTGASAMAYAQARLNGADNTTALAHATTMGVMAGAAPGGVTAREFVPGLDTALTTAERAGTATKAGAKAAAPDVAMGAAKAGGGYLAGEIAGMVPGGGFVKHVLDLPTALVGGRQIGRGLKKGVAAARASYAETAPAEAPATPESVARPTAGPAGAPTDDALLQLYSVETNPAKRAALQAQLVDRGLMNPPGAAPTTPPEANPYRGYSQDALRKVYAIEPDPAKLALIEQAARNRGLSLLSREGRRATAAVPETGAAEARGPSLTQDEALMLRFMGTEDPLSASVADIATARKLAVDNPELLRRLRAGEPEPVVAPPTAEEKAVIAQPPTQAVQAPLPPALQRMLEKAQQTGGFTPEETARAAAILENVEPQRAPAAPVAAPAQTAETAGQLYAREWTARHPRLERLGMFELLDQRTKLAQEYFHKEFTNLTQVQKSAIDGELEQGMPLKPPPPTPAQPSAAAAPAAPQPQSAAPATAAPAAAETPLSWARAEIVDRGGQLPVSEIQRRFKMGYGAATDVLREAQGLRPKGEPIVTPPPTAQPPAPAAAAAPKPAAAELAQQFEATTRPDRMLDFLKRMDPEISPAAIDNLDPNQWELVARGAGSPAGTIPTPEDIAAVRGNLAQSEGASQITAKTPEAAKAQFEQNRNIRKGPAKATAPTGETWFHGTTKTFDNLDPEFSHPGSEHGKAVYLTNKHPEAAKYGDVRSIEFTGKIFPEEAAIDPPLLNEVVRQLKADHPARAQAITDALKRAELTRAKTHDIVLQEISSALPGDFRLRQTAINDALKKLGYSARSYTEDSGAKTLAVFDKDALTHKAPAPVTDLETQLADSLAGKRAAPPPEGARALTAAEERVEAYAQHFAPDTENITSKTLEDLPKSTNALLQLEALGKRLGIKGRPASFDEVRQIVDRVKQLRGEGAARKAK